MQKNEYELLEAGLELMKIEYSPAQVEKIDSFISELLLFNARFDLINAKTTSEIIVRHIFDSLVAIKFFEKGETIADIGSGAGFPGIALAIFLPEKQFTLVERSERRVGFLQNVKAILQLDNVEILCKDFQKLKQNFNTVSARALRSLDTKVFTSLLALLSEEGSLVLYKGRKDKTRAEIHSLQQEINVQKLSVNIFSLQVPYLKSERCILKVEKTIAKNV